jgi:acyl-homoserine lactone acylase PvdQ
MPTHLRRPGIDAGVIVVPASIPGGQSGHPTHPHYDDFIQKWLNFEYNPALWDRAGSKPTPKSI